MPELNFELITPERVVEKRTVESVTLPTAAGEITVLPQHAPLVSVLVPGMITVQAAGEESYLAVTGGFLEVQSGSRLIVLADACDRAEELDLEKVEAARERAHQQLEELRDTDAAATAAITATLDRELARLKVARKHKTRRPGPIGTESLK